MFSWTVGKRFGDFGDVRSSLAKNMVVVFLKQSQSIPLKLSNNFGQVDVWRVIVYVFLPTHVA